MKANLATPFDSRNFAALAESERSSIAIVIKSAPFFLVVATMSGNSALQGPHHVAQKFRTTTLPLCLASSALIDAGVPTPSAGGAACAVTAKSATMEAVNNVFIFRPFLLPEAQGSPGSPQPRLRV